MYAVNIAIAMRDIKHQWARIKTILGSRNISQTAISEAAQVDQATVSRILARCPRRGGKAFIRVCNYAFTLEASGVRTDPSKCRELMSALQEVWNGSAEHAEALAAIIRAAGYAAQVRGH
jgi:hypothetical protein